MYLRVFNFAAYAILLFSLSFTPAHALDCDLAMQARAKVESALSLEQEWRELSQALRQNTVNRLKYPLKLISNEGDFLPNFEAAFDDANFVIASAPEQSPYFKNEGVKAYRQVQVVYQKQGEVSREVGKLSYVLIDQQGQVLEVAATSPVMLRELDKQIYGKRVSESEQKRLIALNTKLSADLAALPEAQEKLKKFEIDRGWAPGFAKKLKLVYFSDELLPLKAWAKKNGFTQEELKEAGWMDFRITSRGDRYYTPKNSNTIKIPFFADEAHTKPIAYRIRVLEKKTPDSPKYLSHPLDRAAINPPLVQARLYNSWKLPQARGKKVVLTEGEFKSAVATEASKVLTLGLPGITEFSEEMIAALIQASPEEVIVILDRDPKGKALMRLDGITDSERAAYTIAREMEDAGLKVKIGTLPDVFQGGKVGVDDLILEVGVEPYLATIETALNPSEFALAHEMDPQFQDLLFRKKRMSKLIEGYQASLRRGGPELNLMVLNRAKEYLKMLEDSFAVYLKDVLKTTRRLDQPSIEYDFLAQVASSSSPIPVSAVGISPEQLQSNILLMDYEQTAIQEALLKVNLEQGWKLADSVHFEPKNLEDLETVKLAGELNFIFPSDDYAFQFGVQFQRECRGKTEYSSIAPIVILKKDSKKVVAIADYAKAGRMNLTKRFQTFLR